MPDFSSQVNEVNEHSVNQDSLDWHLNFLYVMQNNWNGLVEGCLAIINPTSAIFW